jgi:predicted GNAT superfamily acetyltransferase
VPSPQFYGEESAKLNVECGKGRVLAEWFAQRLLDLNMVPLDSEDDLPPHMVGSVFVGRAEKR